jgi:hypothetical protein
MAFTKGRALTTAWSWRYTAFAVRASGTIGAKGKAVACCLERAKRIAIGEFRAHFEERAALKFSDYPLHQTVSHRRCGAFFLVIFCGEDRDPETWRWLGTRWLLIPLTTDELADMELTPTGTLGGRRQELVPKLKAEQWLWLSEGPERGVGQWGPRVESVRAINAIPAKAWPKIPATPDRLEDGMPSVTADHP